MKETKEQFMERFRRDMFGEVETPEQYAIVNRLFQLFDAQECHCGEDYCTGWITVLKR